MTLTLSVRGLAAERGGRTLFQGITFDLKAGEALSLVGPNGAGKSTLLRVLAGLLRPAAGTAVLAFPDADEEERPLRERSHYLGHADGLKGGLSAAENLAFAGRLAGRPFLSPGGPLQLFGLSHMQDLPCSFLSAGQRRRVALARLLVAARPLWLLDEPSTGLDEASRLALAEIMQGHLGAGGLIIAATHVPLGLSSRGELRLGPEPARSGP